MSILPTVDSQGPVQAANSSLSLSRARAQNASCAGYSGSRLACLTDSTITALSRARLTPDCAALGRGQKSSSMAEADKAEARVTSAFFAAFPESLLRDINDAITREI